MIPLPPMSFASTTASGVNANGASWGVDSGAWNVNVAASNSGPMAASSTPLVTWIALAAAAYFIWKKTK